MGALQKLISTQPLFNIKHMIKTYESSTNISINVVLKNKKNRRISFVPRSNGSSVFTTEDIELQNALEQHYNYGNLFKLVGKKLSPKPVLRSGKDTVAVPDFLTDNMNENDEHETAESPTGETDLPVQKVKVNDIGEAKDYLAEKFGISRTSMRKTESILDLATKYGVEFEGL